jgi:hypothetical protein
MEESAKIHDEERFGLTENTKESTFTERGFCRFLERIALHNARLQIQLEA